MAAEVNIFVCVALTIGGERFDSFGSQSDSIKATDLTDGTQPIRRRITVPAGENVTAWVHADTGGFAVLAARIIGGEGYVYAGIRYSSITSSTDYTPTGSNVKWMERGMSCFGAMLLDTRYAYTSTVASERASETASYPTVWSSGTRGLAVADILAFRNEGEEDVVVELFIVPE